MADRSSWKTINRGKRRKLTQAQGLAFLTSIAVTAPKRNKIRQRIPDAETRAALVAQWFAKHPSAKPLPPQVASPLWFNTADHLEGIVNGGIYGLL